MTTTRTQITIHGHLVGPAWGGFEAFKPLTYDLTREQRRNTARRSLRDHVTSIISDGDFQSSSIVNGQLCITIARSGKDNRVREFTRWFDLACFPSISDCVMAEEWFGPDED